MSRPESAAKSFTRRHLSYLGLGAVIVSGALAINLAKAGSDTSREDTLAHGADLFAREWLPNDTRSHGGDGLGPVYNETSCVACHHQGGPGGAGPTSMNVEILTSSARSREVNSPPETHPGLRTSQSVVLHRFGVDPEYKRWRLRLLGDEHHADMAESVETEIRQVQELMGSGSGRSAFTRGAHLSNGRLLQRSPPALFGTGLIDALPDEVLLAAEQRRFPEFPEIRGHANRLKDGRIGRFGWKAETPSLREFVLVACANELGLEVPGHHQALSPLDPDAKAKGLDLSQEECDALMAYVKHLPAPTGPKPAGHWESTEVAAGRSLFEAAGCATCHLPRIGAIEGIYGDLLLHGMGPALADSSSYDGSDVTDRSSNGVGITEWRTPPLWGFRDSGPYLHDGRAKNLEEAVALHGGQAEPSAKRFFQLVPDERLKVQAFLRSLSPPAVTAR